MEVFKNCTGLEQSKILAEFLPIESADMYFEPSAGFCTEPSEVKVGDIKYAHPRSVPCWSLAALLNVLPNNENISTNLSKGGYRISTLEYTNSWFIDYEDETDGLNNCVTSADNPVDACYEMILKLHEQKLL